MVSTRSPRPDHAAKICHGLGFGIAHVCLLDAVPAHHVGYNVSTPVVLLNNHFINLLLVFVILDKLGRTPESVNPRGIPWLNREAQLFLNGGGGLTVCHRLTGEPVQVTPRGGP